MAIKLSKSPAATAAPAATPHHAPAQSQVPAQHHAAPAAAPMAHNHLPAKAGGSLSFMKKGAEAKKVMAQEQHKADQNSQNNTFRFWVPKEKEARITFLDGNMVDGMLDIPFYFEHNINMNGKWGNFFICTQDEEPCPICEGGSQASYVGVLTIIDHSEYVSKKDGQVKKDNVKLFVAKRDTIKALQAIALKTGGLAGQTFDVSRQGDKSPSVGNTFFPVGKYSPQELFAAFKEKSHPLKYEEILAKMYLPAKELRKMGFGSTTGPIGAEAPMSGGEDFAGEM